MTRNIQINEKIFLNIAETFGETMVKVYVDNRPVHICKLSKNETFVGVGYVFNEFYIVIFSRDVSKEKNQFKIEAVYDIVKQNIVQLSEKNEHIFEYMCILKKKTDVAVVLQLLNNSKLQIAEEAEIEEFIKYITAGNENITREQIKEYILSVYPDFIKFMNLTSEISIIEYRKILSELNLEICEFNIMPHLLK